MNRVVLNVAKGGGFPAAADRLERSLDEHGVKADRMFFKEWPRVSHRDVPYQFKVDAFREAQDKSYEVCLWLDSATVALSDLEGIFTQIEDEGYVVSPDGHPVGDWCNDPAKLGYSRDELMDIPLICGAIIGLNLSHPLGQTFLDRWEVHAESGVFNGSWDDHRHDITSGGVIAHEMGLTLTPHLYCVTPGCPETAVVRGKGP